MPKSELTKAIAGITGMMRFGNYNSPILLEILAELMSLHGKEDNPLNFIAMAFYNAGVNSKVDSIEGKYMEYVRYSSQMIELSGTINSRIDWINEVKKLNLEGEKFFQEIRANEMKWIADSTLNPEVEFAKLYYKKDISKNYPDIIDIPNSDEDSVSQTNSEEVKSPNEEPNPNGTWFMYGFLALGAVLVVLKLTNRV